MKLMMTRQLLAGVCVVIALVIAQPVSGQSPGFGWGHWSDHYHQFKVDMHRNRLWPAPFRAMDTAAVMSYLEVQRNNGWRLHNTLGAAMFDPNTHELTSAGYQHLRWIVLQAPQDRRVVFVLKGPNESATAKRVEAVQLAISDLIPVGPLPPIYLTDVDAPGSSGMYQTTINRQLSNSIPEPRLPPAQGVSSATSGTTQGN